VLVDVRFTDREPESRTFGLGGDIGLERSLMMASGKPQPLSLIRSQTCPPESSVDTSILRVAAPGERIPARSGADCGSPAADIGVAAHQRNALLEVAWIRVPDCSYSASTSATSRFRSRPSSCGGGVRA